MAMAESYGKRAMQALLGFGYLLTVLHEKHLGGQVQFTAAALTGLTSSVCFCSPLEPCSYGVNRTGVQCCNDRRVICIASKQLHAWQDEGCM